MKNTMDVPVVDLSSGGDIAVDALRTACSSHGFFCGNYLEILLLSIQLAFSCSSKTIV